MKFRWFWLGAVLVINALFLNYNAFRTFYFYDMSPYMDAGYRIVQGQKPYVDFIAHCGPIHLYLMGLFFLVFGLDKLAILAHLVVVSSLFIGIVFYMLKNRTSTSFHVLGTSMAAVTFYWAFAHPWYNQTAHLFGLAAAAWLAVNLPFKNNSQASLGGILAGSAFALSFLTKLNIGVPYGFIFFLTLLISPFRKRAIFAFTLTTFATFLVCAVFFVHSPKLFLEQTLWNYGPTQQGRLFKYLVRWDVWFENFYWLPPLLLTPFLSKIFKADKERLFLFFGLWFIGTFANYTSSVVHEQDAEVLAVYFSLALLLPPKQFSIPVQGGFVIAALFFIMLHFNYALQLKGWSIVSPPGNYTLSLKPFKGWRCSSYKGRGAEDIADFLNQNVTKTDSLLILTDLQMLYMACGFKSYKGVPFAIAVGTGPPPGKSVDDMKELLVNNPPDWILTHHSMDVRDLRNILAYLKLQDLVQKRYGKRHQNDQYILLKKL